MSTIADEENIKNTGSHVARLCTMRLWPDFPGYGFNLHAEKGKNGHYVGKVDDFSPAEAAGIRNGDKIIEVNGKNVYLESHAEVVQRIKSKPNETTFLVVDSEAEQYFRENSIDINCHMDQLITMQTPMKSAVNAEPDVLLHSSDEPFDLRLCHINSWVSFAGYGFTINADKTKRNQFIGSIDPGSPAQHAGLKLGDRILEVNGIKIKPTDHDLLVKEIRASSLHATILALPQEQADRFDKFGAGVKPVNIYCPVLDPLTRICDIVSTSKQHGFGFNLVADKGKPGHFIDQVEDISPASISGLKNGDHVIAVNGILVTSDTHQQVVEKIRSKPNETSLLVTDAEGFKIIDGRGLPNPATVTGGGSSVVEAELHKAPTKNTNGENQIEIDDSNDYKKVTDEMTQIANEAEKNVQNGKIVDEIQVRLNIENKQPNCEPIRPRSEMVLSSEISTICDKIDAPLSVHPGLNKIFENLQFAATVEEAKKKKVPTATLR